MVISKHHNVEFANVNGSVHTLVVLGSLVFSLTTPTSITNHYLSLALITLTRSELNIDNLIAKNCEIHETLSNFYENTFKNREEEYGIEIANEIFAEVDSDYKLFKKQ